MRRGRGVRGMLRMRRGRLRGKARGLLRTCLREDGQMMVELAVCAPVLLIMAVLAVDMMVYLGDCARFDRVSSQEVAIIAAAPAGDEYTASGSAASIAQAIEEAMGGDGRLTCKVTATQGVEQAGSSDGFALYSLAVRLTTYTCTMESRPWPFSNGVFGVEIPPLTHVRTYVLDPYKPGVIA